MVLSDKTTLGATQDEAPRSHVYIMGKFLVLRKDEMEGSAAKFVYNFLHEISAEAQSYSRTDLFSEIEAELQC